MREPAPHILEAFQAGEDPPTFSARTFMAPRRIPAGLVGARKRMAEPERLGLVPSLAPERPEPREFCILVCILPCVALS